MNQTLENSEKLNFGTDFGQFGPNLGPQFFFVSFTCTRCQTSLYKVLRHLDVEDYHCTKFQGKRMIQSQENSKKTHFGPN